MSIAALIAAAALTTSPILQNSERFSDRATEQLRTTGFEDVAHVKAGKRTAPVKLEGNDARRVYRNGAGTLAKDSRAYELLVSKLAQTSRR